MAVEKEAVSDSLGDCAEISEVPTPIMPLASDSRMSLQFLAWLKAWILTVDQAEFCDDPAMHAPEAEGNLQHPIVDNGPMQMGIGHPEYTCQRRCSVGRNFGSLKTKAISQTDS